MCPRSPRNLVGHFQPSFLLFQMKTRCFQRVFRIGKFSYLSTWRILPGAEDKTKLSGGTFTSA